MKLKKHNKRIPGFQKNTFSQKELNRPKLDKFGWTLQRYTVFFKMVRFFETLELFTVTKVNECHDQKSENICVKGVFLKKFQIREFISKTMIFFVIRANLLLFRDLEM